MRTDPTPSPANLLNHLRTYLGASNDSQLARLLLLSPATLCKLRHGQSPLTSYVLLAMHESSGIPIPALRRIAIPCTDASAAPDGAPADAEAELP